MSGPLLCPVLVPRRLEAALVNLLEPGDEVLIAIHGYFGEQLAEMAAASRHAGRPHLHVPLGEIFTVEEIPAALEQKKYKLFAIVAAETSTGAQGDLRASKRLPRLFTMRPAILLLDTVTSLGNIPLKVDEWEVDAAYSASQKGLGAPSGLAPITVGPHARAKIENRKTPVASFYLDLKSYAAYWMGAHAYHHTASANLHYALAEGLRVIVEEGLDHNFARLRANSEALWQGLEEMDLPPFIPLEYELPPLTTAQVPGRCDPHQNSGAPVERIQHRDCSRLLAR